jgi:hypothetical protein
MSLHIITVIIQCCVTYPVDIASLNNLKIDRVQLPSGFIVYPELFCLKQLKSSHEQLAGTWNMHVNMVLSATVTNENDGF